MMRLFQGGIKTGTAVAIGAGAVLLVPIVIPVVASVMKPLAKAAIKGGMLAFENTRLAIAETKETIEDIAAEARSEVTAVQDQTSKTAKAGAKKAAK
jgi:hypothetical protein